MGEIKGLKDVGGELVYSRSNWNPRYCILVKKYFRILPLMYYCSRDLTAVKINMLCGRGPKEIILGLAYLPYDDLEPPPPREMERLVAGCRADGSHLVIGCDANAYHTTWGSSRIEYGRAGTTVTSALRPLLIFRATLQLIHSAVPHLEQSAVSY
jgi:hypothetical protein